MAAGEVLAGLLSELGRRAGMGEPQADSEGTYALALDGKVVLHLAPEGEEETVLYVPLGPIAEQRRAELHRLMLQANFSGQETGGGFLTLDPAGNPFLLHRVSLATMPFTRFESLIERLGEAALGWRELLQAPAPATGQIERPLMPEAAFRV